MILLAEAAALLRQARAPVVLVGTGARRAMAAVDALGSRLQAAILTTPEAKSQVDETRPESAGVFSFGANAYAVVEAADAVIALGTDLGEFASRGGKAFVGKVLQFGFSSNGFVQQAF